VSAGSQLGVKLLFNWNLSRRLVGMFSIEYPESTRVTDVGRTAARRVRVVIRDVVRDPDARSGSDP
jgi:hypothetical protein